MSLPRRSHTSGTPVPSFPPPPLRSFTPRRCLVQGQEDSGRLHLLERDQPSGDSRRLLQTHRPRRRHRRRGDAELPTGQATRRGIRRRRDHCRRPVTCVRPDQSPSHCAVVGEGGPLYVDRVLDSGCWTPATNAEVGDDSREDLVQRGARQRSDRRLDVGWRGARTHRSYVGCLGRG